MKIEKSGINLYVNYKCITKYNFYRYNNDYSLYNILYYVIKEIYNKKSPYFNLSLNYYYALKNDNSYDYKVFIASNDVDILSLGYGTFNLYCPYSDELDCIIGDSISVHYNMYFNINHNTSIDDIKNEIIRLYEDIKKCIKCDDICISEEIDENILL